MAEKRSIIPTERINRSILLIRGERVILDADLATLYRVTTKALNQAVKRNLGRFPPDFAVRLTKSVERIVKKRWSQYLRYYPQNGAGVRNEPTLP